MQLLHCSQYNAVKVFAFQQWWSPFNESEVLNVTHFNANTREKYRADTTGVKVLTSWKRKEWLQVTAKSKMTGLGLQQFGRGKIKRQIGNAPC